MTGIIRLSENQKWTGDEYLCNNWVTWNSSLPFAQVTDKQGILVEFTNTYQTTRFSLFFCRQLQLA